MSNQVKFQIQKDAGEGEPTSVIITHETTEVTVKFDNSNMAGRTSFLNIIEDLPNLLLRGFGEAMAELEAADSA